MDKQKIIILTLAVALIFVINYFLLDDFFKQNQRQIEEAYLSGHDQGINDTITTLIKQTDNCNIVPIFMGNSSKKLVDLDCLELDNNLNP